VPDYLIDGITFEIMHDPVITVSGHSFDRVSITKHIEQSKVDPITRAPMSLSDLRPNYALKAACDDFLDKNGWAVDW
jgi:STIP1 homology and U-box containing protein 1